MNLKEAFRCQNKLQRLMDEALDILSWDKNVLKVENTALRHKVNPEAEDETTLELPETYQGLSVTSVKKCTKSVILSKRSESKDLRTEYLHCSIDNA